MNKNKIDSLSVCVKHALLLILYHLHVATRFSIKCHDQAMVS